MPAPPMTEVSPAGEQHDIGHGRQQRRRHRGRRHPALVHRRRCPRHRRLRRHRHVQCRARPGAGPMAQPTGRRPLLDRRTHRSRRLGRTGAAQRHPRAGALVALAAAVAGPERRRPRLHALRPARLSRGASSSSSSTGSVARGWSSPPGSPTPTRFRPRSASASIPTSPSARPLVDAVRLTLPGQRCLVTDERGLPTGDTIVAGSELDFTSGRRIGPTQLDTAFTDLVRDDARSGPCRARRHRDGSGRHRLDGRPFRLRHGLYGRHRGAGRETAPVHRHRAHDLSPRCPALGHRSRAPGAGCLLARHLGHHRRGSIRMR